MEKYTKSLPREESFPPLGPRESFKACKFLVNDPKDCAEVPPSPLAGKGSWDGGGKISSSFPKSTKPGDLRLSLKISLLSCSKGGAAESAEKNAG